MVLALCSSWSICVRSCGNRAAVKMERAGSGVCCTHDRWCVGTAAWETSSCLQERLMKRKAAYNKR